MKSLQEIKTQLNGLVSGIRECNFIPWDDKLDIVQDTWVKIIEKMNEGVIKDDFKEIRGYTFQILRNFCLAYQRKKLKNDTVELRWEIADEEVIDRQVFKEEFIRILNSKLQAQKYSELDKEIIKMTLDNLSNPQIREILNYTVEEYKNKKHGLTKRLKADLTRPVKYFILNKFDDKIKIPCFTSSDVKKFFSHLSSRQVGYIMYNNLVTPEGYYVDVIIRRKTKNSKK